MRKFVVGFSFLFSVCVFWLKTGYEQIAKWTHKHIQNARHHKHWHIWRCKRYGLSLTIKAHSLVCNQITAINSPTHTHTTNDSRYNNHISYCSLAFTHYCVTTAFWMVLFVCVVCVCFSGKIIKWFVCFPYHKTIHRNNISVAVRHFIVLQKFVDLVQ